MPDTSGWLLPTPGLILVVLAFFPSEFCGSSVPEMELEPHSWHWMEVQDKTSEMFSLRLYCAVVIHSREYIHNVYSHSTLLWLH